MSGKADTMGFESPLDFSGKRAKEVVLFLKYRYIYVLLVVQ